MKFSPWLAVAAMSVSSLALAQSAMNPGVSESADPAKISAIEQHAQQLMSGAQTTPMMGDHDGMHEHGMHHKHHHKHGMHHQKGKDAKPADEKPMANESKG